jgi:hypothetical protein
MGCPAAVELGNNLTFGIATHDPDTGILTDADTVPTYEVYEEDGDTPILTGSMSKRATGKTGRYKAKIACTTANGFEDGKTYTIEIVATVDGDQGGISYTFRAETLAAAVAALGVSAGTGPYPCVWTVTDGTDPIEGATVAFYAAGVLKGRGDTDADGEVEMSLDALTYTVAITCGGYTFANTTQAVSESSGTWTRTFSMTSVQIDAPTDAGKATGRLDMHKDDTSDEPYGRIYVRQSLRRDTTGHGDSKAWRELVADANGVIRASFVKGLTYEAKRGKDGSPVTFVVEDDHDTFYLPSVLGEP